MAQLMLTWHALIDERTCPICRQLNGYTWIFDSATGENMTTELIHPAFGVVWDTALGSKVHEHGNGVCRCNITADFDLSDMVEKVQEILDKLEADVE